MTIRLLPAIDVRDGRVVRLAQGDYTRETRYDDDPVARAVTYAADGAEWLHLVDLDAARNGGYALDGMIARVRAEAGLRVQTGGGVRGEGDVARILDAGADRVVVGSSAVREPEAVAGWIEQFGADRITVALDTRQDDSGCWTLPVEGWTARTDRSLPEMATWYAEAGLRHLLCTDIGRDGMLHGPNLELYAMLRERAPRVRLQASGGVREPGDLRELARIGCDSVVLGKALLEDRFTVAEALALPEVAA